jgi:hypothetical protein
VKLVAQCTRFDIEALRSGLSERASTSVRLEAQHFVTDIVNAFPSVVLARTFLVLPVNRLPSREQAVASSAARGKHALRSSTRVLSLVGTFGREPSWCDRSRSALHLAIPLVDRAAVASMPMVSRLFTDLKVNWEALDASQTIATQRMLEGADGKFRIDDARTAVDAGGRLVIPARDFVNTYGVRTVFGMGGAYYDGTVFVVVIFTQEHVDAVRCDRFSDLSSSFKVATSTLLARDRIYE